MPITPFQIVNEDGTINQNEYERCINFLQDYVDGNVNVYPKLTWENPFEVDLSQELSAYTILRNILMQDTNRLLDNTAFNNIKKLFTGLLTRYGSTIHTVGRYLELSSSYLDSPGYMYDVLTQEETPVKKEIVNSGLNIYYLDDENHTVLEYNSEAYSQLQQIFPKYNLPNYALLPDETLSSSNTSSYSAYKHPLTGIYSDFYRLAGQYVGSSTYFYYSECNDKMYTTGGEAYEDDRLSTPVNFKLNANVSNKSIPTTGVPLTTVSSAQSNIQNEAFVNAYVTPTIINSTVNYLSPTIFTAANENDWLI